MALWHSIWSNELHRKVLLTVVIVIAYAILKAIVSRYAIHRLSKISPHVYRVNKLTSYVLSGIVIVLLFGVWVQRLGDLTVALGLLAAGIAFALQEVIGSIAGWITIFTGRPFAVGDRIETGGIRGDVIDISILRTRLMEVGNWLDGDHTTGRIVSISNAYIFKEPLYNYSAHLPFIWDEIRIPVTYGSNWKQGRELMAAAVADNPSYTSLVPIAEKQRAAARQRFAVRMTTLAPQTFMKLTDNWIELAVVYPVDEDKRRSFRSEISAAICEHFASAGITVASETIAVTDRRSASGPATGDAPS